MIKPISREEFSIYALSFDEGANFFPLTEMSWWISENKSAVGVITFDSTRNLFNSRVLRRNVDHRFYVMPPGLDSVEESEALLKMVISMKLDEPAEIRKNGEKIRQHLFKPKNDENLNPKYSLLLEDVKHFPALIALGEVYLALDNPDSNFVEDFQTEGFEARLFEMYLFAAFREQGIKVKQLQPAPDFCLSRDGNVLFVEAVTANTEGSRSVPLGLNASKAPDDLEQRLLGDSAERFAKTLRSKMQRRYWESPQVLGNPFALAIADFHQPSSMTWSLPSLASYLYGINSKIEVDENGNRRAVGIPVDKLKGFHQLPSGFFSQPDSQYISCIIATNSATLGKFNRMGFLAGWQPPGLKMIRNCLFFNREGEQLEGKMQSFDISDPSYKELWDFGECWCLELEVYHNPNAINPIPKTFFPGATHFFKKDDEYVFESRWENRIISSVTNIHQE